MLKIFSVAMLAAAGFAITAASPTAWAADLADVYKLAQQNDPQLQQAEATRNATIQNKGIARSGLLPQLSADAQYQKQNGNGEQSQFGVTEFQTFTTTTDQTDKSWSIGLTQPLFRWDRWVSLSQADIQAAQAEVTFDIAKQDLIVRVAQAYLNVLGAEDTLQAGLANQRALGKQLQQAKKKYQVGLTAITDVQQFQAAFDQARATVIADQQAVTAARDALRVIVGVPVGDLREPAPGMPLVPPTPNNAQQWIDMAIQNNLRLTSTRMGAKIAAKTVDIQAAARYPTLDLRLQHAYSNSDNEGKLNGTLAPETSRFTGNSVLLQFSLPIWSGGAISARTRQAKYNHVAAEHQTQLVARQVEQNTRDAFLGVMTGISQVKAWKESVVSATTALQATEAGLRVGTQTTVDVLNARNTLLNAQTQYALSRYQYLLSSLQLKQAAGTLDAKDIAQLNQWMTQKPKVPGSELEQPAQPTLPQPASAQPPAVATGK